MYEIRKFELIKNTSDVALSLTDGTELIYKMLVVQRKQENILKFIIDVTGLLLLQSFSE